MHNLEAFVLKCEFPKKSAHSKALLICCENNWFLIQLRVPDPEFYGIGGMFSPAKHYPGGVLLSYQGRIQLPFKNTQHEFVVVVFLRNNFLCGVGNVKNIFSRCVIKNPSVSERISCFCQRNHTSAFVYPVENKPCWRREFNIIIKIRPSVHLKNKFCLVNGN